MSETKKMLGIILFIIGVLLGAGGGYLYVQNKANPVIAELTIEETTLFDDLQTSETMIVSYQSELETMQNNVDDLDELIFDVQTQLDENIVHIQALDEVFITETATVDELRNQTNLLLNYQRFYIYNLRFQSPIVKKVWFNTEKNKPLSKDNGGIVIDTSAGAIDETIEFYWETLEFDADASVDLETHVNDYLEYLSEGKYNFETSIGDKETMEINGHTASYRTVYIDYHDEEVGRATFCMWYCNETGQMFRSAYVSFCYKSNIEDRYGTIWENTYCH